MNVLGKRSMKNTRQDNDDNQIELERGKSEITKPTA